MARISLHLTDAQEKFIAETAVRSGLNQSEIIRRLIDLGKQHYNGIFHPAPNGEATSQPVPAVEAEGSEHVL